MRRVFLQKEKGEIVNVNVQTAYEGFNRLGYEIYFYEDHPPKDLYPSDIVVGWIKCVKEALRNISIEPPNEIDYPASLTKYLGRKVWKSNLSKITEKDFPIFIKPLNGKLFTGKLVKSFKDMIGFKYDTKKGCEIYCSDPVNFLVEYRVFVRYGKILGSKSYHGDPFLMIDKKVVENAIKDYKDIPNACSMDFGLTSNGKTLLVEVNQAYSLGCYGLPSILYARLISASWSQMTNTVDELRDVDILDL